MTDSSFSNNALTSLESLVLECQLENARENEDQRHDSTPDGHRISNTKSFYEMSPEDRIYIATLPGNTKCADCGACDTEWASVTYGILLCAECSGVHRYVVAATLLPCTAWVLHC